MRDVDDPLLLVVDQAGDTLDATTASQTADRLGGDLDVVAEHFAVTLGARDAPGAALAELRLRHRLDGFTQITVDAVVVSSCARRQKLTRALTLKREADGTTVVRQGRA
eukprot:scaffold42735_cov57-Phaeocystis_antarctica.AAC.3